MFEKIIEKLNAANTMRNDALSELASELNKLLKTIPGDIEDVDGEYILFAFSAEGSAEGGRLTFETECK